MAFRPKTHDNGILEIVFEHPPVNAHRIADLDELSKLLEAVRDEARISAVVLRAQGRGFSAGGDIREMMALPGHEGIIGQANSGFRASLAIAECAAPVIAAVNGYCVGIGVLLAGSADIVVASPDASFTLAEIDFGATAGAIQAISLMPEKRLRVAMFTGDTIPAEELKDFGSIHALAEPDHLPALAMDLASKIAAKDPRSVRAMKASLNGSIARRIRDHYRSEISHTYELNMLGVAAANRETFLARGGK